jgi:parallel beta-helix repeat protein
MKKIIFLIICIILLQFLIISGCIKETPPVEETNIIKNPKMIYVDDAGGADYTSIQNAINHAVKGGTIYVNNGTYYETLIIDKSINLIGADEKNTIIDHETGSTASIDNVVLISADNCTIKGFSIMCANNISYVEGLKIDSSNNTISNNTISYAHIGIYLGRNKNNTIISNIISDASQGISTYGSDNNNISKNIISTCTTYGIYLSGSDNNIISGNTISENDLGIRIQGSKNCKVFENTIKNCPQGMRFCCGSTNNVAYYNVFMQNRDWSAIDEVSNQTNHWDNGIFGNYWDDYTVKYPYATQTDGIWDTPYSIANKDNFDRYPLVNPPNI